MSGTLVSRVRALWFAGMEGSKPIPDVTREMWFAKSDDFDKKIKDNFMEDIEKAQHKKLHELSKTPEGISAVIILIDQFSRNVFRGSGKAFAGDEYACDLAMIACESGMIKQLANPAERMFVMMPFMHSECRAIHRYGQARFEELEKDFPEHSYLAQCTHFFRIHTEQIEKFGRYPHRNQALGRSFLSEEEEKFVKETQNF
eukprot:Nk52_evm56s62 gene=Nk52_evmTU56s62